MGGTHAQRLDYAPPFFDELLSCVIVSHLKQRTCCRSRRCWGSTSTPV